MAADLAAAGGRRAGDSLGRLYAEIYGWPVYSHAAGVDPRVLFPIQPALPRDPPGARQHLGLSYLTGFLAGCFGGAFSAAGPPVIIYVSLQPWRKELIKVTLQGFYFTSGLMVVTAQALTGMVTDRVIELFLYSLAPLTLGTYAGHFFFGKIREETYRRVILILLLCLGVFTIWNAG